MNLGANLAPIVSPFGVEEAARGEDRAGREPHARAPCCTLGSSEAESVGTSPLSWRTGFLALTTTLVPFSDSWKISSKAAKIVSVRT